MTIDSIKWGEVGVDYQDFTLKGVPFRLALANHNQHVTTDERIVLLKNRTLLNTEIRMLDYANPKSMVELGIYEGGSAVFWHLFYGVRYLGFDILKRPTAISNWIRRIGIEKDVQLYYETSQSDSAAILGAVKSHLGSEGLDVVIDDASHQYQLSRRSFEIQH